MLDERNGYALVSSKVINGLRCACLRKTTDDAFTENRDALINEIGRKTGGVVYSGINTHPLFAPFARLYRRLVIATRRLRQGSASRQDRSSGGPGAKDV